MKHAAVLLILFNGIIIERHPLCFPPVPEIVLRYNSTSDQFLIYPATPNGINEQIHIVDINTYTIKTIIPEGINIKNVQFLHYNNNDRQKIFDILTPIMTIIPNDLITMIVTYLL